MMGSGALVRYAGSTDHTTEAGGTIMGERYPRERHAAAGLALCEAPAQDIEVASVPSRQTQQPRRTSAAHSGTSDLYFITGRREPPAAMRQLTGADDPMLGCLLLLNRALQRPVPSAVLLEGLPLEGQGLTFPLLCAAATRAGLSTRLVERELDDIADTSLPVILLLGKNRPCVLLQRCEHGRFLVALPGWDGGVQEVSREDLLSQHRGHAIFALPGLRPEVSTEIVQPCPSPGAVLRQSWLRHCERLLASSLSALCRRRRHPAEDVVRDGG